MPQQWHTLLPPILNNLGVKKRKCEFKSYHVSTKSGPNGQAIMSCMLDLYSLDENPEYLETLQRFGGKVITERTARLLD